MVRIFFRLLSAFVALCLPVCSGAQISPEIFRPACDSIAKYFSDRAVLPNPPAVRSCRLSKNTVHIGFTRTLGDYPLREGDIPVIEDYLYGCMPEQYRKYRITVTSNSFQLDELVSGYYAGNKCASPAKSGGGKWIEPQSDRNIPSKGLQDRHIALWSGHGYYYNSEEKRWKWQRAPYFSTIEDLFPADYVYSFLTPMLENAGARVLIPKERDRNINEVIVDTGSPFYSDRSEGKPWEDSSIPGFSDTCEYYDSGMNPFASGKARLVSVSRPGTATAVYMPFFPENGEYAVYVSYQSVPGVSVAEYKVIHDGGESVFLVDQNIGGGVWVYLGTFMFTHGESGQGVVLTNTKKGLLSADAVRFGGGMGNIRRDSLVSGMPRFAESSRYWLQWSGYPKSVYSPNADTLDYPDDYLSKGLWVNYMKDTLGIPVDMALALHTDAGTTKKDSVIGTLAIYTSVSDGSKTYSDGRQRLISRELADIVQTQIVEDIRGRYRADWSRRGLADRSYFESRMPDVPTVLIELLSHQNFSDMQCGLDPKFKFLVSRAIYKGILKYMAYASSSEYVVQPLPVRNFSSRMETDEKGEVWAVLNWSPTVDVSEPSALPDSYIVQTRIADPYSGEIIRGFDKGTTVADTSFRVRIDESKLYSFKVIAANEGGKAFPSETLSLGFFHNTPKILVVNAFRTVSGPALHPVMDTVYAGFDFMANPGIPYVSDYSYTGMQYEYMRDRQWIHDDNPGFGASFMDYAACRRAGNTFDYPSIHGMAIMKSGMSFCSTGSESLDETSYPACDYAVCDIVTGVDRKALDSEQVKMYLENFSACGGSILVSGSNIGEAVDAETARGLLKFSLSNNNAASIGNILSINTRNKIVINRKQFCFHTSPNPFVYPASAPDAISPEGDGSFAFMRYSGSNTAAAVAYDGDDYRSAVFGFPLETLTSPQQFNELMGEVLNFLVGKTSAD